MLDLSELQISRKEVILSFKNLINAGNSYLGQSLPHQEWSFRCFRYVFSRQTLLVAVLRIMTYLDTQRLRQYATKPTMPDKGLLLQPNDKRLALCLFWIGSPLPQHTLQKINIFEIPHEHKHAILPISSTDAPSLWRLLMAY